MAENNTVQKLINATLIFFIFTPADLRRSRKIVVRNLETRFPAFFWVKLRKIQKIRDISPNFRFF